MEKYYNHLNTYLKNKFGERTLKICIDGGFTCPNRDGLAGFGGCIFCSEKGSGELIKSAPDIKTQVTNYLNSYKAQRANKFIVYFQNFTNTYDSIENLKNKYDSSLIDDKIVGIDIATRPDCITEDVCKLLHSYTNKYDVTVELGLQTSDDEIGKIINRCYNSKKFSEATSLLRKYNINVVAHIMCGLPGENRENFIEYQKNHNLPKFFYDESLVPESIKSTIDFLNKHDIQGIKIHSTYIVKNTVLEKMYIEGNYTPLSYEEYMNDLVYIISHCNPDYIIHRICGDAPKDILVAPEWNLHKKKVLNHIDQYLKENELFQGKYN
ncbi:MAG: TIGR01212 family radical SAM protein [Clostridia bacterium]|nr:TIGR01212 family radical SAM protein [Clostridia bacterium]